MEPLEQLYTVVKGILDFLETIKYVKKKMVFMFSYPKSTEEVMVVRNKWNFDPNLWFSVASVGVISFQVTAGGYTPARHLPGGSQVSFLAGTISEHIKGQGQLPKAGVLFPLRTEWHLQPLLP